MAREPRATPAKKPIGGRRRFPRPSLGLCASAALHLGAVAAALSVAPSRDMAFGSPASMQVQVAIAMAPPPAANPAATVAPEALPIPTLPPEPEPPPEPVVQTPPRPIPDPPVAAETPVQQPLPPEPDAPVVLPAPAPSPPIVAEKPPQAPRPAKPPRKPVVKTEAKPAPRPAVQAPAPEPPAPAEAPQQSASAAPAGAAPSPVQAPAMARVAAPALDAGPVVIHDPAYSEPPTPPAYPPRAVLLGQQGRVVVRAAIDRQGVPDSVAVWESSGHPLLDSAALTAVKRWRFVPARRGGAAIAAWVQVPVNFRLK